VKFDPEKASSAVEAAQLIATELESEMRKLVKQLGFQPPE
jgi:hypothetical protein